MMSPDSKLGLNNDSSNSELEHGVLPDSFCPIASRAYGSDIVYSTLGYELLRNPNYMTTMNELLLGISISISNILFAYGIAGLNNPIEEIDTSFSVEMDSGQTSTISYLGRGSNSWAFLIELPDMPRLVAKLPTYGYHEGPITFLRGKSYNESNYINEMRALVHIENEYCDRLNSANLVFPTPVMAGTFFSISTFEDGLPLSDQSVTSVYGPRYYKEVLVPLGEQLFKDYFRSTLTNPDLEYLQDITIDWVLGKEKEIVVQTSSDGSFRFVCLDPLASS